MKSAYRILYLSLCLAVSLIALKVYWQNQLSESTRGEPQTEASSPLSPLPSLAVAPTASVDPQTFQKPEQVTDAFFQTYLSLSMANPEPEKIKVLSQLLQPEIQVRWSASGSAFVKDLNRFLGISSQPESFTTELILHPSPDRVTIVVALYGPQNTKTFKAFELQKNSRAWQIIAVSPYRLKPQIIR